MKHRLWQIFGPVLLAAILVLGLLLAPLRFSNFSKSQMRSAAVSLSPNVIGGERIKKQALNENYVPFIGSSELARLDSFHPSILAEKYHRSYRPLLIGHAGTQSLVNFADDQTMMHQLRHKKVVLIISLQWFTKQGQDPDAFDFYYSPMQMIQFILNAKNTVADRYAARRFLTMNAPSKDFQIKQALYAVSAGQPISSAQRNMLLARFRVLENEDALFSPFSLNSMNGKIDNAKKTLPDGHPSYKQLDKVAYREGESHTTNNKLGIDDKFYSTQLKKQVKGLKGSQTDFDYRYGNEYSDFELLLNQFAKNDVDVQFVIPPVNKKWSNYTGLPMGMIKQSTYKVKKQLHDQGFNNVLDLTQRGGEKYFMEDTIHIGWRGWLAMDKVVNPFLTQKQKPIHYHMSNYYYSRGWRNAQPWNK